MPPAGIFAQGEWESAVLVKSRSGGQVIVRFDGQKAFIASGYAQGIWVACALSCWLLNR